MVIQRWQSVMLLIAAAMMACFAFFSLGQVQTEDYSLNFTSIGFTYEGEAADGAPTHTFLSTWYFFIMTITTAVLYLIDIFLFKNLGLQIKVSLVSILLTIASMATCGCLGYTAVEGYSVSWSTNILFPFIALIAGIVANSLMRSDRKKLRAVDRIR